MSCFIINPYAHGGQTAPLEPDDIADLTFWWDPNDDANISVSGSDITSWQNKGSGGTATLTTPPGVSGATPLHRETHDGKKWAVSLLSEKRCNIISSDTVPLLGTGSSSVGVVYRSTSTQASSRLISKGRSSSTQKGWQILFAGSTDTFNGGMSGNTAVGGDDLDFSTSIPTINDGATHLLFFVRDNSIGSNGQLQLWFDGVQMATINIPASWGAPDQTSGDTIQMRGFMVGAQPAGGTNVFYQNWVDATKFGDIMIYGHALTEAEMEGLWAHLFTKWNP